MKTIPAYASPTYRKPASPKSERFMRQIDPLPPRKREEKILWLISSMIGVLKAREVRKVLKSIVKDPKTDLSDPLIEKAVNVIVGHLEYRRLERDMRKLMRELD